MDDMDRASAQEELARETAIAAAKLKPALPATGYCYFCSEPISMGERWCDRHCRDDWEREQAALKQRPVE